MKFENFRRAEKLVQQVQSIDKALKDITTFLKTNPTESDGSGVKGFYGFQIAAFGDGSGKIADLTQCNVGVPTLKFIKGQLEAKREVIQAEIATL